MNNAANIKKDTRIKKDIAALMGEICADVRAELEGKSHLGARFGLIDSAFNRGGRASKELAALNAKFNFPLVATDPGQVKSHRPLIGKLIDSLKRGVLSLLRKRVLVNYFEEQAEFNGHLVRSLNEFSIMLTETREEVRKLREGLDGNAHSQAVLSEKVKQLDNVCYGLERILVNLSGEQGKCAVQSAGKIEQAPDYSYLLFENRFRGSEAEIKGRLKIYPPLFANQNLPILEIGSGRGELQELFKESGVISYGVETDAAMVQTCLAKGLKVLSQNGLNHLAELKPQSLGGVIAIQVVEHLPIEVLKEFLKLCASRVVSGGRVVLETVNTESMLALSHNYFRDPTHAAPLHPDTLSYLMEISGLRVLEVKKLSLYPQGVELQKVTDSSDANDSKRTVELINENFSRLNKLIFGAQDYCIIATPANSPESL